MPPPSSSAPDAWRRIHAWLAANAPKIGESLKPPATDEEIESAQRAFGVELPGTGQDLYRTHNGMDLESNFGSLFFTMQFLSLDEAVREHGNSNVNGAEPLPVRSADPGICRRDIHNPQWLPFASNGDTVLRIDLEPGPLGKIGQVIFTDHADGTVILLAESLPEFLMQFAADLEGGRYFLNPEAQADGNEYLSCTAEIDVMNWAHAPKWKHLAV